MYDLQDAARYLRTSLSRRAVFAAVAVLSDSYHHTLALP